MQLRKLLLPRRAAHSERGATVAIVTLSMTVIIGLAAVSIDYSVHSSEKSRLQSAVDGAALSLARDCASGVTASCNQAAAQTSVTREISGASTTTAPAAPTSTSGSVTVRSTKNSPNVFGTVFGADNTTIAAKATASWGDVPLAGTPVAPIGFNYCNVKDRLGGSSSTIVNYNFNGIQNPRTIDTSCEPVIPGMSYGTYRGLQGNGSAGNMAAMLTRAGPFNLGSCTYSGNVSRWDVLFAFIDDAAAPFEINSSCKSTFKKPEMWAGQTILVPLYVHEVCNKFLTGVIWSSCQNTWLFTTKQSNGVKIIGFAPFKITSFRDAGASGGTENYDGNAVSSRPANNAAPKCIMSTISELFWFIEFGCQGINGYFTTTTRETPGFTYGTAPAGSPNYGATRIKLTN